MLGIRSLSTPLAWTKRAFIAEVQMPGCAKLFLFLLATSPNITFHPN